MAYAVVVAVAGAACRHEGGGRRHRRSDGWRGRRYGCLCGSGAHVSSGEHTAELVVIVLGDFESQRGRVPEWGEEPPSPSS